MQSSPTEWTLDTPGFQIFVTSSNQNFSMRAINNATGEQYGPQPVFPGMNSDFVDNCLQNDVRISEVTDNSIKIRIHFYNEPVELLLQQNSAIEKKCNILKIEVEKLKDHVKALELEQQRPFISLLLIGGQRLLDCISELTLLT